MEGNNEEQRKRLKLYRKFGDAAVWWEVSPASLNMLSCTEVPFPIKGGGFKTTFIYDKQGELQPAGCPVLKFTNNKPTNMGVLLYASRMMLVFSHPSNLFKILIQGLLRIIMCYLHFQRFWIPLKCHRRIHLRATGPETRPKTEKELIKYFL